MSESAPPLTTDREAKQLLGLTDDEYEELVTDGTLRRVRTEKGAFVLGVDVDRAARQNDPRWLAKHVAGEVDDDPDGPRALARDVPRL